MGEDSPKAVQKVNPEDLGWIPESILSTRYYHPEKCPHGCATPKKVAEIEAGGKQLWYVFEDEDRTRYECSDSSVGNNVRPDCPDDDCRNDEKQFRESGTL